MDEKVADFTNHGAMMILPTHAKSRTRSPNNPAARDFFTFLYLGVGIAAMILYPVVGFALDGGRFEWFFTGEVFGSSRFSFREAIMDVDQFLANFITTVLFSLVSAFFFVYYGPSRVELKDNIIPNAIKKPVWIFGLGSIAIFIVAAIISYNDGVNGHLEYDMQGLALAFFNFYPENFSVHALYYAYLFAGFPGIFYMIASGYLGTRQVNWVPDRKNAGIHFLVTAAIIMEVLAIASPIVLWDMINASTAIREMFFSLFDVSFITGIVLLVERKHEMKSIEKTPFQSQKVIPRYWVHERAWAILVFTVLGITGYLLATQSMFIQLSEGNYLSRSWSFGFTVTFTLFLYYLGRVLVDSRHQKGSI